MDPKREKKNETAWSEDERECCVRKFCNETSLHGARFLFHKNMIIRLIWFAFVGGSFATCAYYIYRAVDEYTERPFTTTITKERPKAIDFPAITICNLNVVSKEQYTKVARAADPASANKTDLELEQEIQTTLNAMRDPQSVSDQFLKQINQSEENNKRGNFLLKSLKSFSQTIESMLSVHWMKPCRWHGEPCSAHNFTPFVSLKMGQCFTFNSGMNEQEILKSHIPGPFSGLRLLLNLEADDHASDVETPMSGFKVSIQHQSEYPKVGHFGFGLQPGTHTYAAIRQKKIVNLAKPYNTNCSSPQQDFSQAFNKSYSVFSCFAQCFQEYIAELHGCQPLREVIPGIEVCSMMESFHYVYPKLDARLPYSVIDCFSKCPEPCKYYQYETKLSYATAVGDAFIKNFPENVMTQADYPKKFATFKNMTEMEKQEYFRKNIVSLDVYFEEIAYDLVEQKPAISTTSLFGTIGGYLGLFLGMSLLTVLEFVDFLCFWIFKKHIQTNRVESIRGHTTCS